MAGELEPRASIQRMYTLAFDRKLHMPEGSSTTRLFKRGVPSIAKKLSEEGVEVGIEGAVGNPDILADESQQALYNLIVLWVAVGGITPGTVFAYADKILEERTTLFESPKRLAQYVGRAAGRAAIDGALRRRSSLVKSSADLLVRFGDLWQATDVSPEVVGKKLIP